MNTKIYNPKILNLLYELSKVNKLMSKREISRTIKINGKNVSEKTVINWFKFLKKKYTFNNELIDKFTYFYKIPYEKFGLHSICVIYNNPTQEILHKFKFKNYAAWLYDPSLKKRVLLVSYFVPPTLLKQFLEIIKKEDCNITELNTSFHLYSPLHKTINKEGRFTPLQEVTKDLDSQIELLKNYLRKPYKIGLIEEIKENPFFIPVLFEYCYQNYSSREAWFAIKSKLGERIWDYHKRRRTQTDDSGIKKIQQTIRSIQQTNLNHQTKVIYYPLEVNSHSFIYWQINFKKEQNIIKTIKELVKNNVYISIVPNTIKNKFLLITLGDNQSLTKTLSLIEDIEIERMLFLDPEKSSHIFRNEDSYKFKYAELFDPIEKCWNYNKEIN